MAEHDNPNPAPTPRSAAVTCPSCGSAYNTETHEVITDTGLPKRVRELETERDVWRTKAEELHAQLEAIPPAPVPEPAPAPKANKDYFVA